MSSFQLSSRQQREIEFYHRYAPRQKVTHVDYAPVAGPWRRPWNPYWFVYEFARDHYQHPSQRLLDFGCGAGIAAVRFARIGYQVEGFDISPDNITLARELAGQEQVHERCTFRTMPAEQLDYPADSFDLIAGIDILHHIEIAAAVAQAHHVLKPGGVAIFKEHVRVPVIDALRESFLFRWLAPRDVSLDHHITQDERKLEQRDLDVIRRQFSSVTEVRFTLLAHLDRLFPASAGGLRTLLQKLDGRLFRTLPFLARFGGTVVLICRK